ncbi:UNKNOWN [Stylonychia lemnae]|uniref:Uncharacterized protein n=1 Tax=Stylonychia lemnae TaxID=5949 RepID=A0A078AU21_STYLE|nr:UNKNOWN [Stylonychia lemnae]|eukprot:CDW85749.1 UNKNOWN [Stylonychia lemnae]
MLKNSETSNMLYKFTPLIRNGKKDMIKSQTSKKIRLIPLGAYNFGVQPFQSKCFQFQ